MEVISFREGDGDQGILPKEKCLNQEFADRVAKLCHSKYASLPKTGKPKKDLEWTMLSAVLYHRSSTSEMEVVSLATGSKCVGMNKMSSRGDILNDSHAEVLARRGFLRYLYHQICLLRNASTSETLLRKEDGKFAVRPGITFHLYCSHTPCGDASIFPKVTSQDDDDVGAHVPQTPGDTDTPCRDGSVLLKTPLQEVGVGARVFGEIKRASDGVDTPCGDTSILCRATSQDDHDAGETKRASDDLVTSRDRLILPQGDVVRACVSDEMKRSLGDIDCGTPVKRPKVEDSSKMLDRSEDIHRTGAKCVPNGPKQDEHRPGRGYHVLGAVRTKPGRGDPTLSVSCSDKIMRWNCVGLQGALLSLLLDAPIYVESITVGGGCPYSLVAMKRALVDRVLPGELHLPRGYDIKNPVFLQASLPFSDGKYGSSAPQPCPSSLIWCNVPFRNLEVAVEGKKQGVTKKSLNTLAGRLLVCKVELQRQFERVHITGSNPCANDKQCRVKYSELKGKALQYISTWKAIRSAAKLNWTVKNASLLDFSVDNDSKHQQTRKAR